MGKRREKGEVESAERGKQAVAVIGIIGELRTLFRASFTPHIPERF
jgi:hypothetical protein